MIVKVKEPEACEYEYLKKDQILFTYLHLAANKELAEVLLKKGVKAMLHDRLYQSCRYYLHQGYVDVEGLTNVGVIYEAYHELHGNGTGTNLYERVESLPVREEHAMT